MIRQRRRHMGRIVVVPACIGHDHTVKTQRGWRTLIRLRAGRSSRKGWCKLAIGIRPHMIDQHQERQRRP